MPENDKDKNESTDKKSSKENKKANTSKEKNSPIKTAKDALNAISGLPSIDIDDLIDNLLKNTEDSVVNSADWKTVYQSLSSDDKNKDINEVIKDISSLDFITSSSQLERLNKYKDFITVLRKVPIIKKILRLYTTNILAPDDITKTSIKTIPRNAAINKSSEEYISIESKYKVIMDKIDIEDELYDLVFRWLFYGDMFVEILSSKRYLLQTIYNMQIPIKDENIKITESKLDELYDDSTEYNIAFDDSKYKINIEWQKPIAEQLSETNDYANLYFKAVLEHYNINDDNFDSVKNNGRLKYLTESFFGTSNIINNIDSFRAFNESYDSFMSGIINNTKSINKLTNSNEMQPTEDSVSMDKRYSLDYLPTQSTLSSLNIKIHTPDKIIILKDEEIEYGYLYVSGGLDNVNSGNNNNMSNSAMASNSVSSNAVINTSNFMSTSNARSIGMFGGNGVNNPSKLNHARQISSRVAEYIKKKFEEYGGDVNIDNMTPNLQMVIADILNKGSNQLTIRYIPPLNMQQFTIQGTGANSPYGEGVVEDLLFRAKMLLADDTNNILSKFTSTGKRLVWRVNANTHQQAANRIQQASRAVNKKTVAIDNCLDVMSSSVFQNDNIFIAKINGEPEVELETIDLGSPQENVDSNNYSIKQVITGADIPPAHLGYEEWTSGKNTLSSENVVFAQTIIGLQKQFGNALTNLIQKIYTAIYSYTSEFNVNFRNLSIALNSPRGISINFYSENMSNLSNIIGTLKELQIPDKFIINMFWPELYDMISEAEILIQQLNKEALKQQQANAQGGASMGGGDFMGGPSPDIGGGPSTDSLESMVDGGGPPPA